MDNYQKVEQLVTKAGCSYEDARAALEACGWDMLDAVISLEREGKVNKETVEKKAEEPIEIIPEVSAEKIAGENTQQITYIQNDGANGNADGSEKSDKAKGTAKRGRSLWKRIKRIMMNNRMVVLRSNGQQIMNVPIVIPVIALIAFFWATLIIAVIAMVFGCRFHFEGEDLGKTGINSTMDKATDYAEKVRNDLSGKANGEKNTDN
ncbi:MAG: DUF4342 domain-containing protein [Mogibacterium sp.]|nr:DUF4342 domain-containing protein [Mogibacterium sp.]